VSSAPLLEQGQSVARASVAVEASISLPSRVAGQLPRVNHVSIVSSSQDYLASEIPIEQFELTRVRVPAWPPPPPVCVHPRDSRGTFWDCGNFINL